MGGLLMTASFWMGCQSDGPTKTEEVKSTPVTATQVAAKCAADSVPVCGVDGISYRNACVAREIGKTEVKSQGICPGQIPPVEPWWTSSNTSGPLLCGTPDGPIGGGDPIKDPPIDDPLAGTCKDKFPEGIAIKCASTLEPACGCDGKTYRNSCYAMGVGHVYVASKGACPGQPYVEE